MKKKAENQKPSIPKIKASNKKITSNLKENLDLISNLDITITDKAKKKADKERSESLIDFAFNDPSHSETLHKIYIKDNRKLPEIEDSSVHLSVTSPPYFNARDYSNWKSIEEYLNDMKLAFGEVFRVLKPGRKFCLNISDLPVKGNSGVKWIPLGAYLLLECEKLGFELVDRIIWFKTPIKGFQYGSLPYPPSPLICDSMEYIYIFRKPLIGKISYDHVNKLQKESSKLKREEYAELTKQIWTLRRVRLKGNEDGHIAPFPIDIPERCIKLYSFVGETVLDPFGGSGTTTEAAIRNRRNSILIEKEKKYLKYINDRISKTNEDDQLIRIKDFGKFEVKIF